MPQQQSRQAQRLRQKTRERETTKSPEYLKRIRASRQPFVGGFTRRGGHPAEKQPQRPRKHTVKKKDTYASLAEKYNVPQPDLIQASGVTRLTAGQIIPLPPQVMEPIHGVPATPRPVQPDLPGYGGTAEDLRARGAVVTGQADVAGQAAFRAQEIKTTNDQAIISAFNNLKPGARGPQAKAIRDRYNALQVAGGRKGLLATAAERRAEMNARRETMTPDEQARQQRISEGSLVNPWEHFQWWMGGEGQEIDPKTGKLITTTPDPGQTQADFLRQQAQERRAAEMQDYYSELAEANGAQVDADGIEAPPQIAPEYGEPYAIEGYPKTTETRNYSDGENVYYNGRIIPQDEFLDFLEANRTQYDSLQSYLDSEEGMKQTFIQGSKLTLRSIQEALANDDYNMLPDTITPAQLALMGGDRDWDDYMRNVLNYRWDADKGAWIKQVRDDTIGGIGYGSGGGGGGGVGSSGDWVPGSGQTQRGGTGKDVRASMRFAQNVGGIAQVHWRV